MINRLRTGAAALLAGLLTVTALGTPAQAEPADPGKGAAPKNGVAKMFSGTLYQYAGGQQLSLTNTTAFRANLTVETPSLDTGAGDDHTLGQISAELDLTVGGVTNRNIVEVGWTVDSLLNGTTDPHLFVHRWINGVPQGYNAADTGWHDYAGNAVNAGANLVTLGHNGTSKQFEVYYDSPGAAWWVRYNGNWIGYWDVADWPAGFTTVSRIDAFGEVALDATAPGCTDMGDGSHGNTATNPFTIAGDPAWITSAQRLTSGSYASASLSPYATDATKFSYYAYSGSTILYGGGGHC